MDRDIIVRYRDAPSGPLVYHNSTDDEAIARQWANGLWRMGKWEVRISEINETIIARKVRDGRQQ